MTHSSLVHPTVFQSASRRITSARGCGLLLGLCAVFFILAGSGHAASSPQKIGFQGKLLDSAGNPRNDSVDLTFRIFAAPAGGSALWSEAQNGVQLNNGVFSVELGSKTALSTTLFTGASAYLEVEVSPESPMTPRQQLLMSPASFRALLADDLKPGNTSYVQVANTLQTGASFHVASGTVAGPFQATGSSSFTAAGASVFSLNTSSGMRMQAGTLQVDGSGGVYALTHVSAATVTARSGLILPQGTASSIEGVVRWEPTQNLLFIGTGTSNKTLADTDSSQTLENKTLNSTDGNTVDATHLRTYSLDSAAPSNGMTLEYNAASAQWQPAYASTITSASTLPYGAVATLTMVSGTIYLSPWTLSGTLSLNQIRLQVTTARAGVTGDVGIYDTSGSLVASGGTSSVDYGSTGVKVENVSGAPILLPPGQYYAALTFSGGTAPVVRSFTLSAAGLIKGVGTLAGGGTTLPSSITTTAIVDGTGMPFLSFNQ
ncbi:MAG: hypothetical protein WCU88_05395 [Elusimicrobiota bacterium]